MLALGVFFSFEIFGLKLAFLKKSTPQRFFFWGGGFGFLGKTGGPRFWAILFKGFHFVMGGEEGWAGPSSIRKTAGGGDSRFDSKKTC